MQRSEELQLILLRDGYILLYLRGFLVCWLLMFFLEAVSIVAFTQVCSFCGSDACVYIGKPDENSAVISLASPWRVTWRNCVWKLHQDGIWWREGAAWLRFFERCSHRSSIWRWNKYEGELIYNFMWWCVPYMIKEPHIIWVYCYWFF